MSKFFNRTRKSNSIPSRLLREGRSYLIPLYYILRTSTLAREGIENSGSYRFADHIYRNKPEGKFIIGKALDALLLNLKSAKSFRYRYISAKNEIHCLLDERGEELDNLHILASPCGLARELFEVADELHKAEHPHYPKVKWHGLDLDDELIAMIREKSNSISHPMYFYCGDAFDADAYKRNNDGYDMIISLGFSEFLDDEQTLRFYRLMRSHLKPGGRFMTSGMLPHQLSEYLMRHLAELHATYRSKEQLETLAKKAGFKKYKTYQDSHELQTMLVAE